MRAPAWAGARPLPGRLAPRRADMSTGLLNDRWLSFCPGVAEALGLEEAVLLSCCAAAQRLSGASEPTLSEAALAEALPFWEPATWRRAFARLEELGVLTALSRPGDAEPAGEGARWRLRLSADGLWSEPGPVGAAGSGIPFERQASLSVAEAVGLEGAVLVSFLDEALRHGVGDERRAVSVTEAALRASLPFWDLEALRRVAAELEEAGVVRSWPLGEPPDGADGVRLAFADDVDAPDVDAPDLDAPDLDAPLGEAPASVLPADWRPGEATISALRESGVDARFIESQRREFTLYWRERGEARPAWDSRFFQRVLKQWQRERERSRRDGAGAMDSYGRLADRSWAS